MRIVCVIDHLGSGGAQRQLATLAAFLQRSGHTVSLITYHPDDFFRPILAEASIPVETLNVPSRWRRPLVLRRKLKAARPDAVLAFLEGPCLYAELAGLPSRRWGLVVSERLQVSSREHGPGWHRRFHLLADYVTANSHANRRALIGMHPALRNRVATIYNCLDLDLFKPAARPGPLFPVRLLAPASYQPRKNTLGLVRALALAFAQQPSLPLRIDFCGGFPVLPNGQPDRRYFEQVSRQVRELNLEQHCALQGPRADILRQYRAADAVVLPSLLEGLPNTVCEGMACGLPVLASRIGDAEVLVKDGVNGFLFDPTVPEEIASALQKLCGLSQARRVRMGLESRRMAEELFAPAVVVRAYAALLEAAAAKKSVRLAHWPPETWTGPLDRPQPALQPL